MTREERIGELIHALLQQEMDIADHPLTQRYEELKARTTDMANSMRLDLAFWQRAGELSDAGIIGSRGTFRQQAEQMADLSADEMRAALMQHYQEARARIATAIAASK